MVGLGVCVCVSGGEGGRVGSLAGLRWGGVEGELYLSGHEWNR